MPARPRGVDLEKEASKRKRSTVSLRQQARDARVQRAREEEEDMASALAKFKEGMHNGGLHPKDMINIIARHVDAEEDEVEEIVQCGGIVYLKAALESPDNTLAKDAVWALGNIMASGVQYVNMVYDAEVLPCIVNVLAKGPFTARKEAIWALYNLTEEGQGHHVDAIVHLGAIPHLLELLTVPDITAITPSLSTLYNILWWGASCDHDRYKYKNIFDSLGGYDTVDRLQDHRSADVAEEASRIADALILQDREQTQHSDGALLAPGQFCF